MGACKEHDQVEAWVQEVLDNRIRNTELVLDRCSKIEAYALEKEDGRLLGLAYFYRGESYYLLNKIEEMFQNIAKAVGYLSQSEQWELLARSYNLMAITFISRGNAPVAMDYYLAGLNCCKEHNITSITCSIHINLGYLYMQNGVYHEAQHYFEQAYEEIYGKEEKNDDIEHRVMIYNNLAVCYMRRKDFEKTEEYIEKIQTECEPYFKDIDYVYVDCTKARYYQIAEKYELRDACMEDIQRRLDKKLPMLDLFDDLYGLCELALEIKRYDVLWDVINRLEPIVQSARMYNLERNLLTLKLKYYNETGKRQEYLEAAAHFYELYTITEDENQNMVSNMLYVRTALEHANESRKKMEAVNAILMEKSETDPLTGLANRYRLTEYFRSILETCVEDQTPLSVEILDIDYFKEYNDNYGHQAGDDCIAAVAGLIKKLQSDQVFCARYGGDEFIIIYSGISAAEAYEKAEQLRKDIIDLQIEHAYSKALPVVTISQGICHDIPNKGNKSWDFLHTADNMLYRAKKKERNTIFVGDIYEKEIQVKQP